MTRSWTAQMVAADASFTGAPLLRKQFRLDTDHGEVIRAILHASALGEAYLAGQPVSDDVLSPGWSAYEWRLRYRSYDVTGLLAGAAAATGGPVVLGLALGRGWAAGRRGWRGGDSFYTTHPAAIAELVIEQPVSITATPDIDETRRRCPT